MDSKIIYANELLKKLYPEETEDVRAIYPEFYETAKQVRIINWQESWQKGDKRPGVVEKLRQIEEKLDKGEITEEEYKKEITADDMKTYASRVEGISFIDGKLIAFRDKSPNVHLIIHEIGHIHYKINDDLWNSSYGGAEVLFWLGLKKKYSVTDENVRRYIELLKKAINDNTYLETADEITKKIHPLLADQVVKAFYSIYLFMGTIPSGLSEKYAGKVMQYEYDNPIWRSITPIKDDVWMFLVSTVNGLKYSDSFSIAYSKKLGIIRGQYGAEKK